MTASPPEAHDAVGEHGDPVAARMGMWLFLYTELILFGGLFIVYAMYLVRYRSEFIAQSRELSLVSGGANTILLLTSSLTMAMAVTAARRNRARTAVRCLSATIALALAFFVIKYFEWSSKFHHGIYPNSRELLEMGHGPTLFYGLYFIMTGLHALHVLIGVVLLAVMLAMTAKGKIHSERYIVLDNSGLYWHLVDVIWIFLFPLFYLIS